MPWRRCRASPEGPASAALGVCLVSKLTLHRETGAESRLDGSNRAEAARGIEAFRVRIADDVHNARCAPACDVGTVFDQQSPNASFPKTRIDEQRIELGIPVRPWQDCGEADDHAVPLRHEYVAVRDLLDRQRDRVRVCEQGVAIARIGERGAPLQRLQGRTLSMARRTDHNIRHSGILPSDRRRLRSLHQERWRKEYTRTALGS